MKRLPVVLLLFFTLTTHAQAIVPADVDAFMTKVMRELSISGAAVAIVKDGELDFHRVRRSRSSKTTGRPPAGGHGPQRLLA